MKAWQASVCEGPTRPFSARRLRARSGPAGSSNGPPPRSHTATAAPVVGQVNGPEPPFHLRVRSPRASRTSALAPISPSAGSTKPRTTPWAARWSRTPSRQSFGANWVPAAAFRPWNRANARFRSASSPQAAAFDRQHGLATLVVRARQCVESRHVRHTSRDIDDGVLETARLSGIRARGRGRARAIEQRSASERLAQLDREVDARQVRANDVAIRAPCGGRVGHA